ncbi:MAG: EAL domain-containing protein [Aphanocapsa sp. GSE-SYN-MK-11-07L]|jgi:diguanylate cyclase (GGDEF)-like protein/PAS domain S-box-containing protein|nr:EAL domain-containing protein [Aphanocapsa sp. GSE-SYN-MK-11-07L]
MPGAKTTGGNSPDSVIPGFPNQADFTQNTAHLMRLIDTLPGVVFICQITPELPMQYLSQGCLEVSGYTQAELLQTEELCWNRITHPEDLPRVLATIRAAIAQRQPYSVEYRICTKAGQVKWVWEKGNCILNRQQQILHIEGYITDITLLKQSAADLTYRIEFEQLVTTLATRFINIPCDQIDPVINVVLAEIGQFAGVDRSYIFSISEDERIKSNSYEWCAAGIEPQIDRLQGMVLDDIPYYADRIQQRAIIHNPCVRDLPADEPWRIYLEQQGIQSIVAVPMVLGQQLIGMLGFDRVHRQAAWSDEIICLLKVVAEIFVNALERQRAERQLQQTTLELQAVFQALPDLYFRLSQDSTILDWQAGRSADLYIPPAEFLGQRMIDVLPAPAAQKVEAAIAQINQGQRRVDLEYSLPMPNGEQFFEAQLIAFLTDQIIVVIRNISDRKQSEHELSQAEAKYRSIFENATEGIFQSIPAGQYISANPALANIYGYSSPEDLKANLTSIADHLYVQPNRRVEFLQLLEQQGSVSDFESEIYRKNGQMIWISENARAVYDQAGNLLYFEGTVEDITARKQAEITIRYQAFHDLLTGLPNRALLNDRLSVALAESQRTEEALAVMFMDLDRFKTINDTLGHAIGDQLLQQVVGRVVHSLRNVDTIARWGGDEFTLLLPHLSQPEDAINVAERILSAFKATFCLEGQTFRVTCSIGIAVYPRDGTDAATLLRNADAALYQAKSLGRNRYQLYTPSLNNHASTRLTLEHELHKALERNELCLYYQPQIDTRNGKMIGVEALVRWRHPELGLLSPQTFIGLAEESGLIVSIGEWVLRTACQQCRAWQEQGFSAINMAVNLSSLQFQQPNLVNIITQILSTTGLAPPHLELEITESTAMSDLEFTRILLAKLSQMGIGISLDDFGTGYSSLGYLKLFPLSGLKIDRSFICDLADDPQNLAITTAIIALGRGLKLNVVAEGVETEAQYQILRSLGCEAMQGYLFSQPLPVEGMTALLPSSLS